MSFNARAKEWEFENKGNLRTQNALTIAHAIKQKNTPELF